MKCWHRHIVRVAAFVVAAVILVPAAQAGGSVGDVGLARGILQTQFGYSPSRTSDWTTGVCSYADKPSSCYLTRKQALAQSYAEAEGLGARPPSSTSRTFTTSSLIGDVGLARGILETQFGFSLKRAADWTTGVCSYADNPSSCYLTTDQAATQSRAEAVALGAQRIPMPVSSAGPTPSVGFQWGDAGIGAGATLGLVLILVGVASLFVRSHRQHPIHA